jgi:glycosyltransferase involved in cell wall biosynthesis
MTIGIEAERANIVQKTGVEHYVKQLILHLAKIDHENKYVLYLRTHPQQWLLDLPQNFRLKVMPFPIAWTQLRISWEMLWHAPDVLLIPASALPFIHPKNSVVTLHDVAWKYHPEAFTGFMLWFLKLSTWFALQTTKRVISVSQATKDDLIKFYHVVPEKIVVVRMGFEFANPHAPLTPSLAAQLPEKYIVFLSTLQPRKNLPGLIEAFSELKRRHPELPHKLVVVGKQGWKYEPIMTAIEKHKDIVTYVGHIADDDRWEVIARSDLLVQPSFYEGFGMQLLEAYQVGKPTAVSNNSSLAEIGGPGAALFDPLDSQSIQDAIAGVLLNPDYAKQLAENGRHHLESFSWEKCARETLAVLTGKA